MSDIPRRVQALWLLLGLVHLAGCGGGSEPLPELATVKGKVTLDGKPLPDARVVFVPAGGAASAGITDEEGEYALMHRSGVPGVELGECQVQISTDLEGTMDPANEKVPAKYNAQSTLTVTVGAGENTHDFPLEAP